MTSAQRRTNAARLLPSIVSAVAITVALTGCTQYEPQTPVLVPEITLPPSASPTPTASEAPVTTESIIESHAVGEVMTEEDALMLRRDFRSEYGAYQMNDGTWRFIDKAAPLPEEIMTEVVQTFTDTHNAVRETARPGSSDPARNAMEQMAKFQSNSGKRVLVVFEVLTFDESGENVAPFWFWLNQAGTQGSSRQNSADQALAGAEAHAQSQGWQEGTYEIIVIQS